MKKHHKEILEWMKITLYLGIIGFGGFSVLAYVKKLLVEEKKYITQKFYLNAVASISPLPGAMAVNMITFVGAELYGFWGAILGVITFITPSFLLMILLAKWYIKYGNTPYIEFLTNMFIPLILVFITNALFKISKGVFKEKISYVFTISAFLMLLFLKINVIYVILLFGLLGMILNKEEGHVEDIHLRRVPKSNKLYVTLFLISIALISIYVFYKNPFIFKMFYNFFLLGATGFGSGYSVIAVMDELIVRKLQWLNVKEFTTALIVGQITPGPVMITATFVSYYLKGFLGALYGTLGIFLTPMTLAFVLSKYQSKIRDKKWFVGFVKGVNPALVAILLRLIVKYSMILPLNIFSILILISSIIFIIKLNKPLYAVFSTIALGTIAYFI
ncbi:hypothetical protein XO10_03220 [Marinitoga sp. 1135]|uniref:chromate transporter n=1 Tax=unclassified Marinitoga TaxID=2640159 RepID=UPI000950A538|nr:MULTISPECIES: chromate transporter [unclassified Marinitoga]APT75580.1 hypothetical protein LN42_03620 [Marinitoga sp. 1137]NUU95288.1 hypothetical protein [Marinitoga sp. 1135]NUU97222.1 hypothetical protein [Marinitoga sp. 1138]